MEKVSVTVQKVVTAVQGLAHVADTRENPLDKVCIYIHCIYTNHTVSYTNTGRFKSMHSTAYC
jgi:hypothetical protein